MDRIVFITVAGLLLFMGCVQQSTVDSTFASPEGFILTEDALPAYERDIDHTGYIKQMGDEFYHKGLATYRNVCYNCHGNPDQPGSMPNSQRFWQDTFKLGADPYSMYQTLTRGYGLMAPQVRLTPREKYEVIHFIREEYVSELNPSNYFEVTEEYLESLPLGTGQGPEPATYQPWAEMDYGDFLMYTYELADSTHPPQEVSGGRSPLANEDYGDLNFAYKGIAIRLDDGPGGIAAGEAFALFDHDLLRLTGFWTGRGFIDYRGILLNDEHNIYPRTVGKIQFENPIGPGWANPTNGSFDDPRFVAVDGRPFGPLPSDWAHYKGLYRYGHRVILKYTVGETAILESYSLVEHPTTPVFARSLNISASPNASVLRIAPVEIPVEVSSSSGKRDTSGGFHIMTFAGDKAVRLTILLGADRAILSDAIATMGEPEDLTAYTGGGPALYREEVVTSQILPGNEASAYSVDVLSLPLENPWKSRMRPSGIDFVDGGQSAIVCTVDGEVWRLDNILKDNGLISWHRIATGLFQPLGIKFHEGHIYVGCRDQIVRLIDLNQDGETDYYESFNSDHQVTEHFHEFAMGLQTDDEGNFYYAKSGRHARRSLVPQHGTLLKVSADGGTTEILANGFRAANGVCLNPDGSFFVTDQEGYWNPMNRINRVTSGGFYGNMYGYNPPLDSSDAAMVQPLLWVDMKYDRSPAELLWATSDRWGPLNGHLLSLSYGYGKLFAVMPQSVGDEIQASMAEVPVPQFPTGLMRGRFNPRDGQLYTCGMSAWATSQMIQTGGIYRIRYTGKDLDMPVDVDVYDAGLKLTFAGSLDPLAASDKSNYQINTWDLKRTRKYGSDRYNTRTVEILEVLVSNQNKTVFLKVDQVDPCWVIETKYRLKNKRGTSFEGAVQGSVYAVEKEDKPSS